MNLCAARYAVERALAKSVPNVHLHPSPVPTRSTEPLWVVF